MGKKKRKRAKVKKPLPKKTSVIWSNKIKRLYKGKFLIYVIMGISLLLAILLFDPKLYTGGDNATYICLAKSILAGKGYRNIYAPQETPHTQYPPGYPLLIAGIMGFTGNSYIPLKIFSLLLFIGCIYIFYLFLRGRSSSPLVYLPLLLFAINPEILEHSHWILTEIPFLFFVVLTGFLFERWESNKSLTLFFFTSFSAIMCYYIRSIGIAVILGIFAFLLYRRAFKKLLIFLLIALIFITPWVIRNSKIPQHGGYLRQFLSKNPYNRESPRIGLADFTSRIGENLKIYGVQVIPSFVFPSYYKFSQSRQPLRPMVVLLSIIILGIISYGLIRDILKRRRFYHFLLLFYIAICLAWPSVWSCPRFLIPILPFILLFFFEGIDFKIKNASLIVVLFGILAMFTSFQKSFPQMHKSLDIMRSYVNGNKMAGYTLDWVRYYEAADWVKSHTPSNSVVLCRKPNLFYLRSGHKALCYPMTYNHEEVLNSVRRADYVIIDTFFWTGTTRRYLIPAIKDKLTWFKVAYVTNDPKTFVLKVNEEIRK